MGIFDIILIVVGLAVGYIVNLLMVWISERGAFFGFKEIKNAKKGKKKVFLLETENAFWVGGEKASHYNISVTKGRNLVFVAPNSVKPVYGFGGVLLGVGDLYRASTIPRELRQTIVFLKIIGFSDREVKTYLSKIHGYGIVKGEVTKTSAVNEAEKYLVDKLNKKITDLDNEIKSIENNAKNQDKIKDLEDKKKILEIIKEKKEIYLSTPSTIVNYLQTGINRVTLKAQLKQIVDEKMLEKIGQTKWVEIGIMLLLIFLGLWLLFGGGASGLISMIHLAPKHAPTPPPR